MLALASDRAVLNGNNVFSILVISTKKWYPNFLKKVFVFQKTWIRVNVLKTFKIFTDCHIKICRSVIRRAILKIPWYRFLEESMLFLLALKWKLWEKVFSNVKTKINSNFAVKVTERSNHSFLLSVWWMTFFRHLYDNGIKRT